MTFERFGGTVIFWPWPLDNSIFSFFSGGLKFLMNIFITPAIGIFCNSQYFRRKLHLSFKNRIFSYSIQQMLFFTSESHEISSCCEHSCQRRLEFSGDLDMISISFSSKPDSAVLLFTFFSQRWGQWWMEPVWLLA